MKFSSGFYDGFVWKRHGGSGIVRVIPGMRSAALFVVLTLLQSFVPFEAKASLARVTVAPARTGVHQAIDVADPLSTLSITAYRVGCHRPGRVVRLPQPQPVPLSIESPASSVPLPARPRYRRRALAVPLLARSGFRSRPDAERAPPA